MIFTFQHHHGAMLLKYSGISFISGAVNHGFFSGERSLRAAAAGMTLFVLGAVLEHRLAQDPSQASRGLLRTLFIGALLSIGLGFLISVPALALDGKHTWGRGSWMYSLVLGVVVTASSYGTWQWLERNPQYLGAHAHASSETPATSALTALTVGRSIDIRMDDQMRFTPNTLEVQAGETVRLVVRNEGKVLHELVLGTDQQIREHAQQMQKAGSHDAHAHDSAGSAAIQVQPGQSGELVIRFAQPGNYQIACLVAGHYEAGMRGALKVSASASAQDAPKATENDHSKHKH